MSRNKQIATYLSEQEKLSLERIAKKQGRSLSNLVAMIVREYLAKRKTK